ncbi:hypothetical protein EOM86_08175 [Candidatus Nomurabacteria bacterium]|nr:hypothetical protein [Candidatus Nomurabacteria bacterium]
MYSSSSGEQVVQNIDVGYIDILGKIIYIYGFRPDVDTTIFLYINPKSNDIIPTRNQLISIDSNELTIRAIPDYVELNVYPGAVRSNATPRNIPTFER